MPSSYINSDNIGNVYLNRLDGAVLQGEPIVFGSASGSAWVELLTEKFGDLRTRWTTDAGIVAIGIRFPVAWETLTGNIAVPSANSTTIPTGARVKFQLVTSQSSVLNSTNSTGTNVVAAQASMTGAQTAYSFAVINDYALAWCTFSSTARTTSSFGYLGWLRADNGGSGGRYTGLQFPRNLCHIYISNGSAAWTAGTSNILRRVTTENLTAATNLYSTDDTTWNPTINCTGDSTPLILRDSASPFPRVGMTYHLFRIPSSCVIGSVYKLGTDPDNSNKPYVICCGTWGSSFKVGMRVWADGYT